MGIIYRKADISDIDDIVEIVKLFAADTKGMQYGLSYNPLAFRITVKRLLGNDLSYIEIAKLKNNIVGIVGGYVTEGFYDMQQIEAHEMFWYVKKEYRDKNVGVKLLKDFEMWCKLMKVEVIFMTSLFDGDKSVSQFFMKKGYNPLEISWIKEI